MRLTIATVAALLGTVREAATADDLAAAIVTGLHTAFGVDYVTYDDIGPRGSTTLAAPDEPNRVAAFERLAHQHPAVVQQRRTGVITTFRLSDLATGRELRRLELWTEVFRPLGIRYQLSLPLHVSQSRLIGASLSRTGRNFTEGELALAEVLRRELAHILLLQEGPPPDAFVRLGLTPRQAEVLALATRRTTPQVARALGISERTVEKHLELAYDRLGVSSRAEALRLAAPSLQASKQA